MPEIELFKAVIENVVDGIIIIERNGCVLLANPSACNLFGYTNSDLKGQNISALMPGRDGALHQNYIELYESTGRAKIIGKGREVVGKKKDGSTFPMRLAVSELKYNGKVMYTGVIHDLSHRKDAEEKRQHYTAGLEAIIDERTSFLNNIVKTLEQAKEEVYTSLLKEKEVNKLKTQFVSIASHEFRTPLSSIQLSASLIERYFDSLNKAKIFSHINKIKNAVKYLTAILDDFLSVERIEIGQLEPQYKDVNMVELMTDIIQEMKAQVNPHQVINYVHNGITTKIKLDSNLLKHCIYNLLSNAIKYSGSFGKIAVETEINDQMCRISVTDNGIGIPREDQDHLFEVFFRAGNTGEIQGTGLGLNIVKRYAELMNGKVTFESKEGYTNFNVIFPLNTLLLPDNAGDI
ncbi:PAS domain-containing sensor histidine kinase [Mucilaginibacter xinganensis]|uniref:Sensor protein FixL n=1 Tax=Mucilaginibacter xinganensis TaxID=1234841 RepID=A0A223NYX0_9SPHI|nr:PAS domain-containing sensor histidine kinase [Mucilaginibacter xinganensis]ASU34778.1 Cell-division control histidine kinase PdhS [Mucilaginibacter xinganensis]